MNELLE